MRTVVDKQRGAVLIVSLVLLLLITAIAVSTISSSTFQTTMTANAQLRESVLRSAESAAEQPLTEATLQKALNAFFKWQGTQVAGDRVYKVPTSQFSKDTMSAKVLYMGVANAEYFDPKQYKYFVYESQGKARSSDSTDDAKAKVYTEVVQGVAKLGSTNQGLVYDPY